MMDFSPLERGSHRFLAVKYKDRRLVLLLLSLHTQYLVSQYKFFDVSFRCSNIFSIKSAAVLSFPAARAPGSAR